MQLIEEELKFSRKITHKLDHFPPFKLLLVNVPPFVRLFLLSRISDKDGYLFISSHCTAQDS